MANTDAGNFRTKRETMGHGPEQGQASAGAPLAVRAIRVRQAVATYGMGKTKLYALMKEGKLRTVKHGGTRLIPVDAIEALLASDE